MARIKLYESQLSAPAVRGVAQINAQFSPQDFDGGLGAAVDIGFKAKAAIDENEKYKAGLWVEREAARYDSEMITEIAAIEQDAELGAPGHVEAVRSLVQTKKAALMAAAPSDEARNNIEINTMRSNARYTSGAIGFQSKHAGVKAQIDLEDTLSDLQTTAIADPGAHEEARDRIVSAIDTYSSKYFSAADKASLQKEELQKLDFNVTKSRIEQLVTSDEAEGMIAEIEDEDGLHRSRLSGANYSTMRDTAYKRYERLIKDEEIADAASESTLHEGLMFDIAMHEEDMRSSDADASGYAPLQQRAIELRDTQALSHITGRLTRIDRATDRVAYSQSVEKRTAAAEQSNYVADVADFDSAISKEEIIARNTAGGFRNESDFKAAVASFDKREAQKVKWEQAKLDDDRVAMDKIRNTISAERAAADKEAYKLNEAEIVMDSSSGLYTHEQLAAKAKAGTMSPGAWTRADNALKKFEKADIKEQDDLRKEMRKVNEDELAHRIQSIELYGTPDELQIVMEEVERRTLDGTINLTGATRLRGILAPEIIKARKRQAIVEDISSAMRGERFVGTDFNKDSDKEDAWNGVYRSLEATIGEAEGDRSTLMNIVGRVGAIPTELSQDISNAFASQDKDRMIQAAQDMKSLISTHEEWVNEFEGEDFSRGMEMLSYVNAGVDADGAYDRMMLGRMGGPEDKANREYRGKDYDNLSKKARGGDTNRKKSISYLQNAAEDIEGWDPNYFGSPKMSPEFLGHFDMLTKDNYMAGMDLKSSRENALTVMKGSWGVSFMGGAEVFRLRPPEKMFGIPGMSPEANSKWMVEDLQLSMENQIFQTAEGGETYTLPFNDDGTLDVSNVILTPHIRATVGDRPAYSVTIRSNGILYTQKDAWYPDWNEAKVNTRQGVHWGEAQARIRAQTEEDATTDILEVAP